MKAKLPGEGVDYKTYAEKKRAAANKYRKENPEKFLASVKRSKARNKERVKAAAKAWYEENKEDIKEKRRARYKLEKARKDLKPKEIRTCWKARGRRLPPDKYKAGSGFLMIETQDYCVLPRGI